MATTPPFAAADYATVLGQLVPDSKTARSNTDFVIDALEKYAERHACWEQVDVGDGSTRAWDLSAAPFAFQAGPPAMGFVLGYSDAFPVNVEILASAGVPQEPPVFLRREVDFRLEQRTVTGAAQLYLVLATAPGASLARVHFRKRWSHASVPPHHQMAVVHAAAALKCEALASKYRSTVDSVGGSDVFSASETADGYTREAKDYWAKFSRTLGLADADVPTIETARVRTGRLRVFPRGVA